MLVAQALANYHKSAVDKTYLEQAIEAREQLDTDFQGVGARESLNAYI